MDEIFKVFEPVTVKALIDEMFTGYINSEVSSTIPLGDMYELKRMMDIEADKKILCHV